MTPRIKRLLQALTTRRYTALGMGGMWLAGIIVGQLPDTPWWAGILGSFVAAFVLAFAVDGLRWLSCRWLRNHQEAKQS